MDRVRAAAMLFSTGAVFSIPTWPIFSFSSFYILDRLRSRGVYPKTIIDVGANAGQFSVAASKLFPNCRVYAFEPVPDSFAALVRNTKRLENVTCFPLAIGDSTGELSINLNSHSHSSSFLSIGNAHAHAFPHAQEVGSLRVQVTTLDSFVPQIRLEAPVLMKVDVQGFEVRVIQGASTSLKQLEWIILEASFQPLYQGEMTFIDLSNLLRWHGFEFVGPLDWLPHPKTGEILQVDGLYKRQEV